VKRQCLTDNVDELLATAGRWRRQLPAPAQSLTATLQQYMTAHARDFKRYAPLVDAWNQALPPELARHCRLCEVTAGNLIVEAEPGPYMHELRTISAELIEHLRSACPRVHVKSITLRPPRRRDAESAGDL